jgi:hypothetical protein
VGNASEGVGDGAATMLGIRVGSILADRLTGVRRGVVVPGLADWRRPFECFLYAIDGVEGSMKRMEL